MRIGIDVRALAAPHRTGVGEYTTELLSALFKLDTANEYFLFWNEPTSAALFPASWNLPNVHFCPSRWNNKLISATTFLFGRPYADRLIHTSNKPGLNLDYFYSPNPNFTATSAATRFIVTVHDIYFSQFPNTYPLKWRLKHHLMGFKNQCDRAYCITTPSHNTKRDLVDYFKIDEAKIKVIVPGVSTHFLQPPSTQTPNTHSVQDSLPANYILFLGTIEPRKNIGAIIDAYEQAYPQLSSPYHLVIAGAPGWKNQEIFKRIAQSELKSKIQYIGYVTEADKPALYRGAGLFVYPSLYEGFGFPVLEALAAGTPVITSNRSSLPEVSGSAAYLVNPHRPAEIAAGILQLTTNQTLRARQIKNGLSEAARFKWTHSADELHRLFVAY